jgi:hypothetical protein
MFKFAPGKFVEPSTIGLKDSRLTYQVFINQSLTVFVHLQCARKRKKARTPMSRDMGDEMDASIHRNGVAMCHTGIGRP